MVDRIKRIPELRFSNFYNEWQEKKLGDIGKTYTGLSGKTKNDFGFGDSHFITYMNVFKNNIAKFEMTEKVKISNNEKQNKVNYGDIFFTTSSEVPQEVGMTSIWLFKTNNVYLNSFCFGFRITINNVLPIFLARYLRSENIRKKITILAQGSTRFNLSKKEVMKLSINFPEINEQQKIGDFFSKLDRQIELEERKLELLEQQKKGYMQKIFSQKFRFKDENGNDYPEWEDKLISDIGKVVTGNTPSKKDNDYWNSNQYVWVTPTDISNKKNIYTSGYQLSQKGFSKARQLPKNTLLITCIASIGKNAILRIEGSCNQQINAVIPNDNYDVDYLYYAFEDVSKLMKSIAGKTATQIVNKAVFEKLLLNVPIYEEQQKISGFLNKVDILIDKQTQKIDELKLRKQGFLQKMFV
ncbi:restriction endonuclease subunit S [Staphylococcus haemolyticus]|uniref:restriction endonuclease subunit S n=1 Tax=Staphylococcus haemolyticus TaxID=1283 RepID=UPI0011AA793D|nr:restriction endonuclease subunit S [Staphylococcus haemolyticus]